MNNIRRQRFAIRTIRNGRVKILGHYYEPTTAIQGGAPLPEKFEGMRAAFGLYWGPENWSNYDECGMMDGICLWGTEEMYHAVNNDPEFERLYKENPFCEDGIFKWEWWKRVVN